MLQLRRIFLPPLNTNQPGKFVTLSIIIKYVNHYIELYHYKSLKGNDIDC